MIGPNSPPTAPVPNRCTKKNAIRIPSEERNDLRGQRRGRHLQAGDSQTTEIAGVSMPSP